MLKAIYLSVISGRFIRYEDIPGTSHTPQLLASNCFLSEKGDSKVGWEFLNLKFHRLIGNKHDTIYTEYEFSLDGKWSTLNLSTSSFLKFDYQLSRLLATRSMVFLHFNTASESTGTDSSFWKKVGKSLLIQIHIIFYLRNFHRRWRGELRADLVFGLTSRFFISHKRSWDVAWFDWYWPSWCYLQIILKSKWNDITCYLSLILPTLSSKYHQIKN